ncbi:hypothetical protein PGTUg99_027372 [Puccinia graminis f. sp. tritici]|uniref:Uncharacterized protein n=1 Tax=Puccinia graminis f. sp. tritici TaxID=56615 RepID=A0A5B0RY87_PUCGR|nr:hypothetical protein PGTUg99_027372 [Puccinia graminis f. sp. tritici]
MTFERFVIGVRLPVLRRLDDLADVTQALAAIPPSSSLTESYKIVEQEPIGIRVGKVHTQLPTPDPFAMEPRKNRK